MQLDIRQILGYVMVFVVSVVVITMFDNGE